MFRSRYQFGTLIRLFFSASTDFGENERGARPGGRKGTSGCRYTAPSAPSRPSRPPSPRGSSPCRRGRLCFRPLRAAPIASTGFFIPVEVSTWTTAAILLRRSLIFFPPPREPRGFPRGTRGRPRSPRVALPRPPYRPTRSRTRGRTPRSGCSLSAEGAP
jgi:hypothetical protein